MDRALRYLVLVFLIGGLAGGTSQWASTQSSAVGLGPVLTQSDWGKFKIEDIAVCSNGSDAWAASVGPGALDDFQMFKITGLDTGSPAVDENSTIFFGDNDFFGPGPGFGYDGTGLPAGMGPRGFPGLAVDFNCQYAYVANSFLDSVIKVDLAQGADSTANSEAGSVVQDDGSIVWPANYSVDRFNIEGFTLLREDVKTVPTPIDVQLNSPSDTKVITSSSDGALYVLDEATGATLDTFETGGVGSGSIVVAGDTWAAVVENSRDVACVDFQSGKVTTISGLGINPFMGLASADWQRVYVTNQSSNTVSVLSGGGCSKSVVATIDVGNAPRHMALSPDNRFLYVSNSTDNSVSVIDTASLSVVDTISIAAAGEPAPAGMLVVSGNNRYLYVIWEGGIKGTPGQFQIMGFDVCHLYSQTC